MFYIHIHFRVNIQYLDALSRSISIPTSNQKSIIDKRMEITEFLSILYHLIKENKLNDIDVNNGLAQIFQLIHKIDIETCVQLLVLTTWTESVVSI